jgi:Bacterial regulatory proteins, luxR family
MANGRSNKEIGTILYISENTVKGHVKSILTKLDAMGPYRSYCHRDQSRADTSELDSEPNAAKIKDRNQVDGCSRFRNPTAMLPLLTSQ